ncbi:MAG TPA: hypothetical protein VMP67_03195 [Candidatus Limnocylindria bacterium]|nr:hypothetical protein [Candidatus Limnocylindria bacterium]
MSDPLSSLIRQSSTPLLPAFERLAPPPPENLIAAELTARTTAGDVVLDLHARGGWIARSAISALRRIYTCESSALTKLQAEVLLRPPDLRHFDAAIATLAAHPRGDVALRDALSEPFASRCTVCGRPIVVDEFIWEGDAAAPARKVYRCAYCRLQSRGPEQRNVPVDEEDVERATSMETPERVLIALRGRFPVREAGRELPDELLNLYTPRTLVALEAIIARLENDLRAAPLTAALRLGLVSSILPTSKLNSYPGRVAALRIQHGRVRPPGERQWRERNPWLVFEEGCRQVRSFVQRVESNAASFQPRLGEELEALIDGSANMVLRSGSAALPANRPFISERRTTQFGRPDPRGRVRLVLTQPPIRWTTENLSFAYLASSLALGPEAAAELPLEWLLGTPPRNERGREATALRRSLLAVEPVLSPDASAVVLLDRGGPEGLVAGVLGGVGAGFRLTSALLSEVGEEMEGVLEFSLRPPTQDQAAEHPELAGLTPAAVDGPFELADVERAVREVAVAVLKARGEPARFERLLGEVLIGLDRLGHLRRLVGTETFSQTEARVVAELAQAEAGPGRPPAETPTEGVADAEADSGAEPEADSDAEPEVDTQPAGRARRWLFEQAQQAGAPPGMDADPDASPEGEEEHTPAWALGSGSATDHVKLFMELVMSELRRPDHPRLTELEPGRWWLRDQQDLEEARPPLSDRIEWAIFGLLSTARSIDENAFFDRVARMFRGHDAPDEELVRAILESYRDPEATEGLLSPRDDLAGRHAEHGTLVGMLVEYGHRLGLRCWAAPREQRRAYREGTVGDLLTEEEQRVYLPLVVPGEPETLETTDCIWYLRGRAAFLFEVEWTAMVSDVLLRRGPRIPTSDSLVRFLVVPPERAELLRLKLARSPLLREALDNDNWHILKSDQLRRLFAAEEASLDALGPLLGLDPEVERQAEQLNLFMDEGAPA